MSALTILQDVADGITAALESAALTSLGRELTVYDHEPKTIQIPAAALLGPTAFDRRAVDEPEIQLGARAWDTEWTLRIYLDLTSTGVQAEMRALLGGVIDALDNDESLGGVALDSVIANGEMEFGKDDASAREYLIYRCDLAVRTLLPD